MCWQILCKNKMKCMVTDFKALELLYYFKFFSLSAQGLPLGNIWSPDEQFGRNLQPEARSFQPLK